MKKQIACMLAFATMLTGLVGCGAKPAANENPGSNSETTSVSQPTDEKVTLKISVWDYATSPDFDNLATAYKAKHPNVEIEYIDTPSAEYNTKLGVMLNSGSDLDVVWVKDGDTVASMAQKGQLADLTEMAKKDNIDLSKYSGSVERFVIDGKMVAMPVSCGYYVLYYNKDIFDAANIAYPTNDMTWTEFEDLAAQLTSGEGADKKYGALFHTWNACVQNWGVADGKHTVMDDDLSFMKPYYEMVLRMQNETKSCMDYATLKTSSLHYSNLFLQGNIAMMPMGSWFMLNAISAAERGETSVNWGVATLPHAEGVEAGYTVGSVTPLVIPENCKNKEAAWDFIKFVSSEEGAKVYAENGSLPAMNDESTLQILAARKGMPEGVAEALKIKNISFDRPIDPKIGEVNQMLNEQHSLIMLGEIGVDEGIAAMEKNSKEIRG